MGLREAGLSGPAAQDSHSWAGTAGVATAAMAASMLALYAVSALGPALAQDMQLPRSAVGALVTATFWARLLAGSLGFFGGFVVGPPGPGCSRTGPAGAPRGSSSRWPSPALPRLLALRAS